MILKLDMNSDIPIYQQLRNQIILGIGRGDIKVGQRLPTVRALASEIGINTMTVNKTYAILKSEGFIEIDRRHGAKVAEVARGESESAEVILKRSEVSGHKGAIIDNEGSSCSANNYKQESVLNSSVNKKESFGEATKTKRVLSHLLSSGKGKESFDNDFAYKDGSAHSKAAELDNRSTENILLLFTEAALKGVGKEELLALCKNLIGGINIKAEV